MAPGALSLLARAREYYIGAIYISQAREGAATNGKGQEAGSGGALWVGVSFGAPHSTLAIPQEGSTARVALSRLLSDGLVDS